MNAELNQTLLNAALAAVFRATSVTTPEILSARREYRVAYARLMVYALLRERLMTQEAIGVLMDRDHAAVLHGVRRLQELARLHPMVARQFAAARTYLQQSAPGLMAERLTLAPMKRALLAVRGLKTNTNELRELSRVITKHLKKLEEPQA
jgi:hypothetical protein